MLDDNTDNKKKVKVKVDHTTCIGCSTCVVVNPQVFEMDAENKSVVKEGADLANQEALLTAAKACPVSAILVYDDAGNQIYPVVKY